MPKSLAASSCRFHQSFLRTEYLIGIENLIWNQVPGNYEKSISNRRAFGRSEPEEIRCPGAKHRVRNKRRRAGVWQPSTGRLHLHFQISPDSRRRARRLACSSSGGPEEIRTPDPYNANVMRYQVVKNYAPSITTVRALI